MKRDRRMFRKCAGRLALSVAVAIASMNAGTAVAHKDKAKCQDHDARIDVSKFVLLDPSQTPPGYDWCGSAPATGTLRGTSTTCQRTGTFVPFGDVFGTGDDRYVTTVYFDTFVTRDGTVFIHEYDVYDGSLAVSLMKVVGGTGNFAGATGTLMLVSELNHDNEFRDFRVSGFICPAAS
jgi:hypothetical protein